MTDYLYRDEQLSEVCFYDFVRCFKTRKKSRKDTNASSDADEEEGPQRRQYRTVRHCRYKLQQGHQLWRTHELQQVEDVFGQIRRVPRILGRNVPRRSQEKEYSRFMFAHFKPFSKDRPLYETVCTEESVIQDFRAYNFTQSAKAVMDNWEALNESSDAREAEWLKKERANKRNGLENSAEELGTKAPEMECVSPAKEHVKTVEKILQLNGLMQQLREGGWFTQKQKERVSRRDAERMEKVTESRIASWLKEFKVQEKAAVQRRSPR